MSEYIDVEYRVVLNVHSDDVPTCGDVADALWDQLPTVYTEDAIHVARVSVEPREGMATVYGPDGSYLGCIGVEKWQQQLLDEGGER